MATVASLLMAFPAATVAPEVARARATAFSEALAETPSWAVKQARLRWLKGDVDVTDHKVLDWPPSPPRLRLLADEVLRDAKTELLKLRRLMEAGVAIEYQRPAADVSTAHVQGAHP